MIHRIIAVWLILLIALDIYSQESAKEEIGNIEYFSDEIVDEKLEKQRSKRLDELLSSPELLAQGKRHTYSGNNLDAIEFPIGAFGGGHLILDGNGKLKHWKIFNNNDLAYIPNSFFAIKVRDGKNNPISRVLQTTPIGPFKEMDKLIFQGEYPFAWLQFLDEKIPIEVFLFQSKSFLSSQPITIQCAG